MADALCGPSNPLQQFKQQTQFDRTLQQDRLTARQPQSQGFRSADPNAGHLDPEFEAFQAGLPPSDFAQLQSLPQRPAGPSASFHAPSWASDFERMHISQPPSFPPAQPFRTGPADASTWAQNFQQHIAHNAPRAQNSSPSPQAFQHMARYGMNNYQPGFARPVIPQAPMQSKGKTAVTDHFDDAAFERAFDQAREALMAEDESITGPQVEEMPYMTGASTGNTDYDERVLQGQKLRDYEWGLMERERQNKEGLRQAREEMDVFETMLQTPSNNHAAQDYGMQLEFLEQQGRKRVRMAQAEAESFARQSTSLKHDYETQLKMLEDENDATVREAKMTERLEDDSIAEEMLRAEQPTIIAEDEQMQDQAHDDDALAMTAQELLEKVDHNQTDKFRNSQFLALMRKLRDREVKVEGDKMVEIASASTTTTPLNNVRFDNTEQTPRPVQAAQRPVDAAPFDYQSIPPHEQDLDVGRYLDPRDGQEVVDLLNQPTTDNDADHTDDIGTSFDPASFPQGVFYGDLRQRGWPETKANQAGGSDTDGRQWDVQTPGRVSQPSPGMH